VSFITLTTDWGLRDFYVAALKGSIYNRIPDVRIVDITHLVSPFNIQEAAYYLKNCYRDFPVGTIHVIGVNTEMPVNIPFLIVQFQGHFFVGSDNGIFSLICQGTPEKVVELTIKPEEITGTFSARQILARVASELAAGGNPDNMGMLRKGFTEMMLFMPVTTASTITGHVIHIDNHQNAITNISKELFIQIAKQRSFVVQFTSGHDIDRISRTYSDVVEAEVLVTFNSSGLLEIAINKGNAAGLLNLKPLSPVTVRFTQ
jgi:S-adenosyl-L-methionine hydrolase (adenosine-forming)